MMWATDKITVHIEDVPRQSILSALLAIESADLRGVFDQDQHNELTTLVLGLRKAMDDGLPARPFTNSIGRWWSEP